MLSKCDVCLWEGINVKHQETARLRSSGSQWRLACLYAVCACTRNAPLSNSRLVTWYQSRLGLGPNIIFFQTVVAANLVRPPSSRPLLAAVAVQLSQVAAAASSPRPCPASAPSMSPAPGPVCTRPGPISRVKLVLPRRIRAISSSPRAPAPDPHRLQPALSCAIGAGSAPDRAGSAPQSTTSASSPRRRAPSATSVQSDPPRLACLDRCLPFCVGSETASSQRCMSSAQDLPTWDPHAVQSVVQICSGLTRSVPLRTVPTIESGLGQRRLSPHWFALFTGLHPLYINQSSCQTMLLWLISSLMVTIIQSDCSAWSWYAFSLN